MTQNFSQKNNGLSVSSSLGDDDLLLRAFHGEDRISGLFHYQLELISEKPDLDMAAIVGETMTAKMLHPAGEYMINGLVARFVQAGTNHRFTTYYAELRPWLWMLTMVVDSRIFQEKSTTEIIEELFGDAGFSDFRIDCKGTYNPREYCVQYQESVFDFISRLMEDEGIFYFWEHEEDLHTMVLADDTVPPGTNHALARAFGHPHVGPVLESIGLLEEVDPPLSGNLDGVTSGVFQFDRMTRNGELKPATHGGIARSDEALLQATTFLAQWLDGEVPAIIDPYAELGTPPLPQD